MLNTGEALEPQAFHMELGTTQKKIVLGVPREFLGILIAMCALSFVVNLLGVDV